MRGRSIVALVVFVGLALAPTAAPSSAPVYRIDHVADGDTVNLTTGARVRLVQIDTPEVYFQTECYGHQASAVTKQLLPPGTAVRLLADPRTDKIDAYGRLLRYVVRARDGLNVNVYLVRVGAAAPYFYDGVRGRYAAVLDRLARRARARHLGEQISLPQRVGDKRFASLVELLETERGKPLVRIAYTTGGAMRRGPVTLRARDLEKLHDALRKSPSLAAALGLGGGA